ncbi:MAG: glutamate--cysteine ligase [Burkholderiaceae bacterium]
MVPHLITALNGPINELEQRILDSMPAIERWFRLEWMEHTPPFYSSVDVRNAGFKLAPVDTNLFPGGWSNLTPAMLPLAVQAAMVAIEKICPEAKNLLLIPENHSNNANNTFYLSSIAQLRRIFHMAGLNVRVGSIDPDIKQNTTVELPNGESIVLEPVIRSAKRLGLKDFEPCTILLNNELTKGLPGILEELHEQFVLPPLHASGSVRRKSTHYKSYEDVCKRFGKLLGVDPWLINPMFLTCTDADLATTVDTLLAKIKKKYKEYGITDKPFVVVKTNHSSLADKHAGSSVMMLRQSSELKDHKDIAVFSGELVVQEGVLTKERMNDAVAEPVVYMMDRYVVGGFYRVHADRGMDENLCSPGSRYVPLAFAEGTELPQPGVKPGASAPNRFYMYGVIGRLAMLAASYELEATDPNAEIYE